MPNKPTVATINTKLDSLIDGIKYNSDLNERCHNDILMQLRKNEESFHSLFQNGPITQLQREMVRLESKIDLTRTDIEDKMELVKVDFDGFKRSARWFGVVLGLLASPAAGWATVKLLETIFHLGG